MNAGESWVYRPRWSDPARHGATTAPTSRAFAETGETKCVTRGASTWTLHGSILGSDQGGTAINPFLRAMPRLFVGIDPTYLPVPIRQSSLREIDDVLGRISADVTRCNLRLEARRGRRKRRQTHLGE